jgi:hypothetical protein
VDNANTIQYNTIQYNTILYAAECNIMTLDAGAATFQP